MPRAKNGAVELEYEAPGMGHDHMPPGLYDVFARAICRSVERAHVHA